jgi:nicotinate-nucleotide adenylyltransferase
MQVTDIEARLGLRFSVETVRFLVRHRPGVRFVWIIGADSFANLHRWKAWREILRLVPLAVVDRPGWTLRAQNSRAARTLAGRRLPAERAGTLASLRAPAWVFLSGRRSDLSSTALRDKLLRDLDLR